jgi:hypothetical protein
MAAAERPRDLDFTPRAGNAGSPIAAHSSQDLSFMLHAGNAGSPIAVHASLTTTTAAERPQDLDSAQLAPLTPPNLLCRQREFGCSVSCMRAS